MDTPEKDMDFELVEKISKELPENIIVQFHNNGESLLYPEFGRAVWLFKNQIKCLDTNGKLLLEKSDEIINHLDTLTISVIENDTEGDEQYDIVNRFVDLKGTQKPFMVYRLLGNIENKDRWNNLQGIVATRTLHDPYGSFEYEKEVTIPEHGICMDLLSHLVIDSFGDVYPCVRFNPHKYMKLGNIKENSLLDLWNSPHRLETIQYHIKGNRHCNMLCSHCHFYGCPTSY
jgi:radical SAM protein with 4Fe4S-binding SPASM domain